MKILYQTLFLSLLYLSLVCQSFSQTTETETYESTDYIGNMDSFDRDNGTRIYNNQYQTGHKTNPGTYDKDFDLESQMTISEINSGFDLKYGVTVDSHPSNATLATCTSLTQNSDCRDIFKLTIALFDGNEVVQKFEHEVELDFKGIRDYSYSQTIQSNNYNTLTGNFELYGIDAGYPTGWYGPKFSDPYLTTQWDVVTFLNEEVLNLIENSDIIDFSNDFDTVEVDIQDIEGNTMDTMTIEVEQDLNLDIQEIEVVEIQPVETPEPEMEVEVAEVEMELEAEVEPETMETVNETNNESEETAEETSEEENQPEVQETKKQKVVAQAKQKAAKKIINKMGDKGKYDSTNQMRTLVVMQVLGNTKSFFNNQATLQDNIDFFSDATIPDNEISDNNYATYLLIGGSDVTHNELIDSQYKE